MSKSGWISDKGGWIGEGVGGGIDKTGFVGKTYLSDGSEGF